MRKPTYERGLKAACENGLIFAGKLEDQEAVQEVSGARATGEEDELIEDLAMEHQVSILDKNLLELMSMTLG